MVPRRLASSLAGSFAGSFAGDFARLGRLLPCLVVGLALAPDAASAQYMALTAPPKAEAPRAAMPKPPPQGRRADHIIDGALPNQRTGPSRQRVVRDICIGCDR